MIWREFRSGQGVWWRLTSNTDCVWSSILALKYVEQVRGGYNGGWVNFKNK